MKNNVISNTRYFASLNNRDFRSTTIQLNLWYCEAMPGKIREEKQMA
ncbi:MAG: hypothetical protein ACT6FF_04870 [Methanosarcinaceae archaeon]